jgi:GNAT superfamily N-acetyltransferase
VEILTVRYGDPDAVALVSAAMADLATRYDGNGDGTPVDEAEFAPPLGSFLVVRVAGQPAGCGGWRTLVGDPDTAEIKRMYTDPRWRGLGVATAVLRAIEDSARTAGRARIALETGDRQPEAIALYRKLGYLQIPNFGYYRDHPGCLSFGRPL